MSAHSELKRGRRLLGSILLDNSAKGWGQVRLLEELIYLHVELICVRHVFWKVPTFPSFCLFSFRPVCIFPLILIKLFHLHIPDALWEIITVLGHFIDLVLYGRHCTESAEMNKSDTISAFGKCLFISRPGSALSQTIQGPAFGNCCAQTICEFTLSNKDKWYPFEITYRGITQERGSHSSPPTQGQAKASITSNIYRGHEVMPKDCFLLHDLALNLMV